MSYNVGDLVGRPVPNREQQVKEFATKYKDKYIIANVGAKAKYVTGEYIADGINSSYTVEIDGKKRQNYDYTRDYFDFDDAYEWRKLYYDLRDRMREALVGLNEVVE